MSNTPNSRTSTDTPLSTNSKAGKTSLIHDSDSYSESYFDKLYSDNSDPWHYQTRWYEQRKRDMCLAVLPQATYKNAIELGCGNGVFSELLARRCQDLISIDGNNKAVQLAKQRLADATHVRVVQGIIPSILSTLRQALLQAYPSSNASLLDHSPAKQPPFDLIVISEVLYYLSPSDIDTVIAWIGQNLAKGGTLLCCHWRYAIDGFKMTGETIHRRLQQAFGLVHSANDEESHIATFHHQSQTVDSDFLLDIWQNSPKSVAMQENLV